MSKRDYVRSIVIFILAVYFVDQTFEQVSVIEASTLVVLMGICVFNTMDVREDITKRLEDRKKRRDTSAG